MGPLAVKMDMGQGPGEPRRRWRPLFRRHRVVSESVPEGAGPGERGASAPCPVSDGTRDSGADAPRSPFRDRLAVGDEGREPLGHLSIIPHAAKRRHIPDLLKFVVIWVNLSLVRSQLSTYFTVLPIPLARYSVGGPNLDLALSAPPETPKRRPGSQGDQAGGNADGNRPTVFPPASGKPPNSSSRRSSVGRYAVPPSSDIGRPAISDTTHRPVPQPSRTRSTRTGNPTPPGWSPDAVVQVRGFPVLRKCEPDHRGRVPSLADKSGWPIELADSARVFCAGESGRLNPGLPASHCEGNGRRSHHDRRRGRTDDQEDR